MCSVPKLIVYFDFFSWAFYIFLYQTHMYRDTTLARACPGGAIAATTCMTYAQYDAIVAAVRAQLDAGMIQLLMKGLMIFLDVDCRGIMMIHSAEVMHR